MHRSGGTIEMDQRLIDPWAGRVSERIDRLHAEAAAARLARLAGGRTGSDRTDGAGTEGRLASIRRTLGDRLATFGSRATDRTGARRPSRLTPCEDGCATPQAA
jgi:hypothetical protein